MAYTFNVMDLSQAGGALIDEAVGIGTVIYDHEITTPAAVQEFETNIEDKVTVEAAITAVQAGTGDPAPDNVRAITGFSEINIYISGKNLIPIPTEEMTDRTVKLTPQNDGTLKIKGTATGGAAVFDIARTEGLYLPAGSYFVNETTTKYSITVYSLANNVATLVKSGGGSFVLTEGQYIFVRIGVASAASVDDIISLQLEKGTAGSSFEAYNGDIYNVEFTDGTDPLTVYGGYVKVNDDGTAELWKTEQDFIYTSASYYGTYGTDNANMYYVDVPSDYQSLIMPVSRSTSDGSLKSNFFLRNTDAYVVDMNDNEIRTNDSEPVTRFYFRWDGAADVTAINTAFASIPLHVVISLKNPVKVCDLPDININTLLGTNNTWCDTGVINKVTYKTSKINFI